MSDVYKIGISVVLGNLVSAELLKIIQQFGSADKAALGFAGKLGMVGAAVAVVGAAFSASVKEASKFETELAKFRLYGLGDKLNEDAKNFAMNMKVAGINFTDAMHFMNEAQGVFRQSGRSDEGALAAAKIAAPVLSKIAFIDKALYGKDDASAASPESLAMLRWIDMTGGANDAKRFAELADVGFKLKTTSGGQIDWEQLRQFRARAKSAGFSVSDEMYAAAEPIIGELKGSTAGVSLSTAYNRAHGIVRMGSQGVADAIKFGIWNGSKVELNSLGGIKKLHGDPLVDAEGYDQNFIKWYMEHVKPVYDKMGLTGSQRIRENALIFGGTGGNLMSLVDRQAAVIGASQSAFSKAKSINEAAGIAGETPSGKSVQIAAEWSKLLTHIGEDLLPIWNVALKATLSILEGANWLFEWTHKPHPLSFSAPTAVPRDSAKPVLLYVDGRLVAQTVTQHQENDLRSPARAGSGFDGRWSLLPVN